MTDLLETKKLRVTFGGLRAVDDVDLQVPEGRLVGLIGPNGAGKTTFIDAVSGFVPVSGGSAQLAGNELLGVAPHGRQRLGLVRTFQSLELFEDLSVRENLLVGAENPKWWSVLRDLLRPNAGAGDLRPRVDGALELLGISDLAERMPTELSNGQRKLVAVGRALVSQPRLLLLDEPAAGLDTTESQRLGRTLRSVLEAGITMLLVDHDMGLVLRVCDYIYVLDFGRVIAHGTPTEIRANDEVIAAYLGTSASNLEVMG
jgi:branched-chain amino acid transport system ATP-binding protein